MLIGTIRSREAGWTTGDVTVWNKWPLRRVDLRWRRIGKQASDVVARNDLNQVARLNMTNFHKSRLKSQDVGIMKG